MLAAHQNRLIMYLGDLRLARSHDRCWKDGQQKKVRQCFREIFQFPRCEGAFQLLAMMEG